MLELRKMLLHNYPGGLAEPSENDDKLTDAVKNALKVVDIDLTGTYHNFR